MKKQTISTTIFFVAIAFFLSGALSLQAQTVKLRLIETSDVHGALFPWDFINDKPAATSLAQVYTYVQEQRADKSQSVILLDNGDILQGQPLVYYSNFEKTNEEHIVARVMNYMKYDAATVGNHDIEPGHLVYDKIEKEFNFPWMAANAVDTKTGQPYFVPYTILNRDGVKIAILGLITPGIPMWLPEKIWSGIEFQDMIVSARKWVKIINEKEHPDVMIGLFHAGVEANYNGQTADMVGNENAAQLVAEQVPGFDVILVGHDHHGWNYRVKNPEGKEVLILGTLASARTAAEATLVLNKDNATGDWNKKIEGEIIPIENYKPDPAFMAKFEAFINEVKVYVAKPIGVFTESISTRESLFGDSPFVDLIQRIQLDITHADVSFAAPLSFNAEIKRGEIYVRDMFNLYKYENLLYTMNMSGQEIKDYLEYSYGQWFNQMKNPEDDLLNFNHDENGNLILSHGRPQLAASYYNFSSAAGIIYTVDVTKPAGDKITIVSMADGKPFDLEKNYTVAMNSYRGNGGGGHLTLGAKIPKDKIAQRVITSTQKDLRYYLMKWIENEKTVSPKSLNNWSVIPTDWWQKGKEKDMNLMFNKKETANVKKEGKTDLHIRSLVDTIGFTQYQWQLDSIFARMDARDKVASETDTKMVICPHDDYAYAGGLFASTLAGVKAKTIVLIGVAHKAKNFNLENKLIFDSFDAWKGTYGNIPISPLRNKLISLMPPQTYLVHDSMMQVEHSLEALTPFLQKNNKEVEIIPILIPYFTFKNMKSDSKDLAKALYALMKAENLQFGKDVAIVITTDAIHYGNEDWGGKDMAPFGVDSVGTARVVQKEMEIVNNCLLGELSQKKAKRFSAYMVQDTDYKEYKWTWCGRYSVPFGLMFTNALSRLIDHKSLSGTLIDYRSSLHNPHIEVKDLGMGTTAPANQHHWVGYVGMVFK